jgi:ubiquinone/menaquinone biosynthesis C-methylase UbiE
MSDPELAPRYPDGYWDKLADYLAGSKILQHNDDYLEFLVGRVWALTSPCRLVEFGCGSGIMGFKLMRLLPAGSTYSGIDSSAALLARGRELAAHAPWPAEFHEGSIFDTPFAENSFDVALTHAVLMHAPHPDRALAEMIRVTRPGGLVITCEANRNAHTALLHIEESNHQEDTPLELFQTINREIRRRTGVDHNIGVKMPILMERAGLRNVQARLSDAVRVLIPPLDTEFKARVFKAICDEGYGQPAPDEAQRARWKANLVGYGITEEAAEREIAREIDEDILDKGSLYHLVYAALMTWSFGTKAG